MAEKNGNSNGAQQNSVKETNTAAMGDGKNMFNGNSNGSDTEFLNSMGTGMVTQMSNNAHTTLTGEQRELD